MFRRLLDHLEVDDPLARPVHGVGPDDRVQGHARLSGSRCRSFAHGFPAGSRSSSLPSPVTTALAAPHPLSRSSGRVASTNGSPGLERRRREHAHRPRRGRRRAGRRDATGVRRDVAAPARRARSSSRRIIGRPRPSAGRRPSARPRSGAASAQHHDLRLADPAVSSIACSAPAPPSVVAQPPTATGSPRTGPRPPPRVARRCRTWSPPARSRSSSVTSPSPQAITVSTITVPPSSIRPNPVRTGRQSGPLAPPARSALHRAAQQRVQRASPPSATGTGRTASTRRLSSPRRSRPPPGRR